MLILTIKGELELGIIVGTCSGCRFLVYVFMSKLNFLGEIRTNGCSGETRVSTDLQGWLCHAEGEKNWMGEHNQDMDTCVSSMS